MTAIIRRNGSGKSTLLKTIARLLNPIDGKIIIDDLEISKYPRNEFARKAAFVSTELFNLNNLKVIELVSLGRFPYTNWLGKLKPGDKVILDEVIELFELCPFINKYYYNLSDGEKQKVMIARAMIQDTPVVILDEPTAFLDMPE